MGQVKYCWAELLSPLTDHDQARATAWTHDCYGVCMNFCPWYTAKSAFYFILFYFTFDQSFSLRVQHASSTPSG